MKSYDIYVNTHIISLHICTISSTASQKQHQHIYLLSEGMNKKQCFLLVNPRCFFLVLSPFLSLAQAACSACRRSCYQAFGCSYPQGPSGFLTRPSHVPKERTLLITSTLQETNISHLGKFGKSSSKVTSDGIY